MSRTHRLREKDRSSFRRKPLAEALALAISLGAAGALPAATITVDSAADVVAADGLCTLREAIVSANTDSPPSGDCAAGSGNDVIQFEPGVFPPDPATTINLGAPGELVVDVASGNLEIQGNDYTTVSAAPASRVFNVTGSGYATIGGLTITGGSVTTDSGGGIRVENSILILQNSTVSGNTATEGSGGGIYVTNAELRLVDSTVSNNTTTVAIQGLNLGYGAGISVYRGSLQVTNSTISNNQPQGWGAGGGISFVYDYSGSLNISGSHLTNNNAIYGGGVLIWGSGAPGPGPLTVQDSTISGNTAQNAGGGIIALTQAPLQVQRSSISGNQAEHGGGIYLNNGALEISGSTISGNSATGAPGYGGGLFNLTGTVLLLNSTVSGNIAGTGPGPYAPPPFGGGIQSINGFLDIEQSTISHNQGVGLYAPYGGPPTTTINRSILANSVDQYGNPITDCATGGNTAGGSGNLIEDDNCFLNAGPDPMLGPLSDNGGPTRTHGLRAGSPAIDAIDCPWLPLPRVPLLPEYDQRGIARPQNGSGGFLPPFLRCDIGAYERANVINVDSTDTNITDNGNCTLPEAIISANTGLPVDQCYPAAPLDTYGERDFGSPDGSLPDIITIYGETPPPARIPYSWPGPTINFAAGYDDGDNALPAITSPITIEGSGTTLRGDYSYPGGSFRAFEVTGGNGDLTLDYLRLQAFALDSGNGGAIKTAGPLTLRDSKVSGWSSTGRGGGIYAAHVPVLLERSDIRGYAEGVSGRGGGLYLNGGSLSTDRTRIQGHAGFAGGGIFGWGTDVSIDHSKVNQSRAGSRGGGIYLQQSGLVLTNSVLTGNRAFSSSYVEGIGQIHDCQGIGDCVGGAIFVQHSDALIANSTLSNNRSLRGGSAIHMGPQGTMLDLVHSTISRNTSYSTAGSALYGEGSDTATLFNSVIGNNRYYSLYSEVAVPGVDCLVQQGGAPVGGFNSLVEYNGNCALVNGVDGNLLGYAPLLGPLQNNTGNYGFPQAVYAETHAPLVGSTYQTTSPAIDAARSAECIASPVNSQDQVNRARPESGGVDCDMGALEVPSLPNLTVEHIKAPPGRIALIGDSFDWTLRLSNVGRESALFNPGELVLRSGTRGTISGLTVPLGLSCLQDTPSAGTMSCYADIVPFEITTGQNVDVSFTASLQQELSGSSALTADPDKQVVESSETDNTSELFLEVRPEATTAPDLADLRVTLRNYPASTLPPGNSFRWGFALNSIINTSSVVSVFPDGAVMLRADLPAGNVYDPPVLAETWSMTGNPVCSIALDTLTCTANGDVLMGPYSGMRVNLPGTLGAVGDYHVPADGGICMVDPDGVVDELDEINNECNVALYSGVLQSPVLCGGDNVSIPQDTVYPPDGSPWTCIANFTLDTQQPVVLFDGGVLYYEAPRITLGPGFRVETGGEFHAGDSVIPTR